MVERGVLTVADDEWARAVRRAQVIGQLADGGMVGAVAADAAASELGISRRLVYELIGRWRRGEGVVTDLLRRRSSGGRGRQRLPDGVEAVIRDVLRRQYLSRQRRSIASVHREIVRVCRSKGVPAPSRGSVVRRISRLDPADVTVRREGPDAARTRRASGGQTPPVGGVLERVQLDHTVIDVIVVDERNRLPIGRPYLTAGIDEFSRCLPGLVVTLEAPSAVSVGLCLAHMAADKRPWLQGLGLLDAGADGQDGALAAHDLFAGWRMSGKPAELYVDNAAEFRSEALRRGCEQHGIRLLFRPPGRPHYGGIVERVIGTMMQLVHELPGTTFSHPGQRRGYPSEARAAMTVRELERWLALAVAVYHGEVHGTTGQTPAGRWAGDVAAGSAPRLVTNETAFLVDFLPVVRRTLTRTGFVIDHVGYFSDALKPWIARREQLDRFVIRRDPRDISRIWVLDPDGSTYLAVPYRTLSHPPVSVWEQRAATARLREAGQAQVNEDALFRMIAQMRSIAETATTATRASRRVRREVERRTVAGRRARPPDGGRLPGSPLAASPGTAEVSGIIGAPAAFDVEEW